MAKNDEEFEFQREKRNFNVIVFSIFVFFMYLLCWFVLQFGTLLEVDTLKTFSNVIHSIYSQSTVQESQFLKFKKLEESQLSEDIQNELSKNNQYCLVSTIDNKNLMRCYYRSPVYSLVEIDTKIISETIREIFYLASGAVVVFFLLLFYFFYVKNKKSFRVFEGYDSAIHNLIKERDFLISKNKTAEEKNKELSSEKQESVNVKTQFEKFTQESQKNQVAMFNMLRDIDEARKEAESASQAKSIFLACMTHELRTPMNGIIGMINSCLDMSLEAKQKEFLEIALSSSNLLLAILNEILDYVKIQDKKLLVSNVIFDVNKLVEQTIGLFTHQFREKELDFVIDLDPAIPITLIGDPDKLQKVLRNLISNALKFTSKGYVLVTTNLVSLAEEKARIQFNVTDTGIGISDEQKIDLYKPFHQVDSSITRKYGGMGLGLILSKELLTLMNGQLDFTSELNKGSDFFFTIDFNLPPSTENDIHRFGGALPYTKEIVVLSNNYKLLKFFERSLGYLNQKVKIFDNFIIYKKALEESIDAIDLIIIDQAVLSNVYDLILTNEKYKLRAPVVYMTSHLHEMKESEIVNVTQVLKPLTFTMLKNILNDTFSLEAPLSSTSDISVKNAYKFINTNAKILVVEDNPVNQIVIKSYLERLGLDYIKLSENGQAALDQNDLTQFDLVFTDIQMPVMDGLSFSKFVRQNLKIDQRKLPIIALSAHSFSGEKQICYRAGMNDYLSKPIVMDLLINCLIRWIPRQETIQTPDKAFVMDEKELSQMRTLLGQSFEKIVATFIIDATKKFNDLLEATKNKDYVKINTLAHQLKSSTASFGAISLAEYLRELEKMGSNERLPDNIDAMMKKINEQFNKLVEILSKKDN